MSPKARKTCYVTPPLPSTVRLYGIIICRNALRLCGPKPPVGVSRLSMHEKHLRDMCTVRCQVSTPLRRDVTSSAATSKRPVRTGLCQTGPYTKSQGLLDRPAPPCHSPIRGRGHRAVRAASRSHSVLCRTRLVRGFARVWSALWCRPPPDSCMPYSTRVQGLNRARTSDVLGPEVRFFDE